MLLFLKLLQGLVAVLPFQKNVLCHPHSYKGFGKNTCP